MWCPVGPWRLIRGHGKDPVWRAMFACQGTRPLSRWGASGLCSLLMGQNVVGLLVVLVTFLSW